jgi:DNA sulfur modification protein DndC
MKNQVPAQVQEAEVVFISHSGGKDSQAQLAHAINLGLKAKLVVVHADLGEMEHENMVPFIEANSFGLPVHVVKSENDFFWWARKYSRIPDSRARFCTSELKTAPIAEFIHAYMYKHGFTKGINATGIRAEESPSRAKKNPVELSDMTQVRKHPTHVITDWLPVFDFTLEQVWQIIKDAGQRPHKMYAMGFTRLSCAFCVLGKVNETQMAAKLYPEKLAKMEQLENDLGKTIRTKSVKGVKGQRFLREYVHKPMKEKAQKEMAKFLKVLNSYFGEENA